MYVNIPHLFITFMKDGEKRELGPFFTASPAGRDGTKWVAYEVQTKDFQFDRVIVPYYHTLKAIVSPARLDVG